MSESSLIFCKRFTDEIKLLIMGYFRHDMDSAVLPNFNLYGSDSPPQAAELFIHGDNQTGLNHNFNAVELLD